MIGKTILKRVKGSREGRQENDTNQCADVPCPRVVAGLNYLVYDAIYIGTFWFPPCVFVL